MTSSDLINSSLQSLSRTKGRAVLTMLGIVIGIMSVIMMLTIGEAAQRYILSQVSAFGSDIVSIGNGPKQQSGQPSLFLKQSLTIKDVKKLQTRSWVSLIAGKASQTDTLTANGLNTDVTVVGTMPDETRMNDIHPATGSFITTASVDGRSREIVLGHDIADKAFGAEDPLGKTVKISNVGFKVIGVMAQAGSKGFTNVDKQVYVPVTAALDLYNFQYLNSISIKTTLPIDQAKDRIAVALRDYHNLENPTGDLSKDDFNVTTQQDAIDSASQIAGILQILLTSIAAISLIVGGIGIMNIMYVSVTERIKEIGLRKAIGARRGDILGQFLVESIIQTVIGGIIGITFGVGLSWIIIRVISSFQEGWTFGLSTNGIILGLTVSAAIGIVFGYFPARKASALHPIDALRTE
jgi:putative ABC transport system permease protein